jgi:hypothetical protein
LGYVPLPEGGASSRLLLDRPESLSASFNTDE